jgi:hypothetical protein
MWKNVEKSCGVVGERGVHGKKKFGEFHFPSRDVTNQTLTGGKNLIISGQGEFG